jgi:hypothetical protein
MNHPSAVVALSWFVAGPPPHINQRDPNQLGSVFVVNFQQLQNLCKCDTTTKTKTKEPCLK